MKKVVIFGSGNVARLAHFCFTHDSEYEVVAFTIHSAFIKESTYMELPVVGFETISENYPSDTYAMFIALGAQERNEFREKIYHEAKAKGYQLVNYISSKAQFWHDLRHGDNVFIIQATSIEPFVEIGNNVTLIGTQIGQNVKIEDNCFISTATIGSDVTICSNSFIGINALVNPFITIGNKSVIGSGALISKDTDAYSVYSAPPARKSAVDSRRFKLM